MFSVYLHTNTRNGKRYVGQTKRSVGARWTKHVWSSKSGSPFYFHAAIRKHGPDTFAHEVLETVETIGAANEAEEWWIGHFCSDDARFGYNLTAGGKSSPMSPATKAKIGAGNRGKVRSAEARAKVGAANRGRRHTPDTLARMAEAHRGQTRSAETRAKMAEAWERRKAGG